MNRWGERLKAFNTEWNDLPRRLLWIVILLVCLVVVGLVLPYVAPFVLAALFAWLIEPVVRFATKRLGGGRVTRGIASAILVLLLAGLVLMLLFLLLGRIIHEVKALAVALPGWVGTVTGELIAWVEGFDLDWPILQDGVEEAFLRLIGDAATTITSMATRLVSFITRGALRAASMLPQSILFIVLTLMGTFYMSADRERIFAFLRGLLPEKYQERSSLFRASILRAVLGQIRAALIMLMVTFTELSIGFLLMGLDYAILFALVIALLDALPVIGSGLFLIPMCIYGIVVGDMAFALGGGLIYLMTIVVRQLLEPRILGRQLGLYPLATMMAMYAGLHAMGFLGLILGPLMLLMCKVALTADPTEAAEAAKHKPLFPWRRKGKRES